MSAAIYARKSTEQTGVSEDERSVTRQVDHARAYAERKGWTVAAEHIYVDDGVSGAEFLKRPGLLRLMNALKPRPPFAVLIMSEEARLGREQIETAYVLKQIIDAGVRVFFYLEDRERPLDTALDKVMLSLTNFAAEMEREKARQRTHDAMLRKARALHVTGGRVYGYDNLEVLSEEAGPDGRRHRKYVIRRVNPKEAAVVRQIFTWSASGQGLTRIAKTLNAEGIAPPGRHTRGWAPTAVREILRRELYHGVMVWNRTRKVHRGGTRRQSKRPPSEWLRLPAPALRIMPEALWQAVEARLRQTGESYVRHARTGRLGGRRSGGDFESPYLLSGLGQCGVCGGSLVAMTRGHGRHRARFYGCVYHHKRGAAVCSNAVQIRQEILDGALLGAISQALDEHVIEAAVARALEQLRSRQRGSADRRVDLQRELQRVQARIGHLLEAVKRGRATDVLLETLEAEIARKALILKEIGVMDTPSSAASLDARRLVEELKTRASDARGLLARHVPQARRMLRALLDGRLVCEPFEEERQRGYTFRATGTYAGLFAAIGRTNDGRIPLGPPLRKCWSFRPRV
jgi:DNA invertase Pin-like site-specific DNA recombinase